MPCHTTDARTLISPGTVEDLTNTGAVPQRTGAGFVNVLLSAISRPGPPADAEMRRASTIDEWYENIQYAVWRMDQALERLMRIPGVTIALASDHGGMPYGIAGFGADADEAALPRLAELVQAIQRAGVAVAAIEKEGDPVPADAQAVLLAMETQAQLTWLVPASEGRQRAVLEGIRALPFVRAALDQNAQRALATWPGMCDIYITTRPPY